MAVSTLYPRPDVNELLEADRAHLIHPLYHPEDHQQPSIFVKGEGATLIDAEGHRYIDGLACLWNVNIGHGRKELAEAAYRQMTSLEYASCYTGASNVPAIELAQRIVEHAYPTSAAVFFTSGGAKQRMSRTERVMRPRFFASALIRSPTFHAGGNSARVALSAVNSTAQRRPWPPRTSPTHSMSDRLLSPSWSRALILADRSSRRSSSMILRLARPMAHPVGWPL